MSFRNNPTALSSVCAFVGATACSIAFAQIDVTTQRYDPSRLGANLQETTLNTSNVNVNEFGKLWSYTVSGSVYAQPLYVRNVNIAGGTHNVLYVVTMNDIVYAFDADSSTDAPLLSFDLTSLVPGSTPPSISDILGFNDNIIGNVGIESTPVIDLATNTMYLVARTREMGGGCGGANPTFCQKLHAIDIRTLAEKPGSPAIIGGNVPGNGGGSAGGILTFDTKIEDQRSSLALSNGRIFIAWSSHSDVFDYHGWVMAYDAATLDQTMIWTSAPDSHGSQGAGIWMGGRAPAVDASGNVYYTVGNGDWDGVNSFGESFVKFGSTPDAPLLDYYTPRESVLDFLNSNDLDLGSSGPILVPNTDLVISGGKSGIFYMTHGADMGHQSMDDMQIVQQFDNSNPSGNLSQIKAGPVFWNRGGASNGWMYVWSDGCNYLKAYRFNGTTFDAPPGAPLASQSTLLSPCGSSGGVLTLSADGGTPGSGVVWASIPVSGDANSNVHPGMLRAFDADNLSHELWNSRQNQARDDAGNWPKFSAPTVVNGRVYLGSFPQDGVGTTKVNVYGLLAGAPADFSVSATPPNPGVVPGASVDYTIAITADSGFAGSVHLAASGLPSGASASFSANDVTPPANVTMTVDTTASIAFGQYTVTVTADGDSAQHSVDNGLYVTDAAAGAGVIGIDFVGTAAPLAATDAAGVTAKPNWNDAAGLSGNALALIDESGVATGATLDWNADSQFALGISGDADFTMMDGVILTDTQATTLSVAGLPENAGGYIVIVYADGDNGDVEVDNDYALTDSDGNVRTIRVVDPANTDFDGTYNQASNGPGNYAAFFVSGDGFSLTATPASGDAHAPINGVQIIRGDRIFANGFD